MAFWGSPSKEKRQLIASIDQGTSSSRFMVFDKGGNVVSSYQQEHKQFYPKAGHVEHDAEEIWQCVKTCISYGMYNESIRAEEIVSLGITNQRETTVVWNKRTGVPYHNAIVWNDTRTTPICEEISSKGHGDMVTRKTGLPISCYFSATKIAYLLREVEGLRAAVSTYSVLCSSFFSSCS
jgi:glycerol kinase